MDVSNPLSPNCSWVNQHGGFLPQAGHLFVHRKIVVSESCQHVYIGEETWSPRRVFEKISYSDTIHEYIDPIKINHNVWPIWDTWSHNGCFALTMIHWMGFGRNMWFCRNLDPLQKTVAVDTDIPMTSSMGRVVYLPAWNWYFYGKFVGKSHGFHVWDWLSKLGSFTAFRIPQRNLTTKSHLSDPVAPEKLAENEWWMMGDLESIYTWKKYMGVS